jgi:peptidoglycan/xylan/chitin deacetylase (PgdA/CDA1 family)
MSPDGTVSPEETMSPDGTGAPARRSVATEVSWRLRAALTPERRTALRRATDSWVGPLGSLRGARTDGAVALTYDDGPGPATAAVLDVLARHGAGATFFVLVERAEAHPDLVRRIVAEGHEVALHGVDHRRLTTMDPAAVRAHIAEGRRRLEDCAGVPVRWFRPPYGSQTPRTFAAARRCGLGVVVWTCDADDWIDHEPAEIATLALDRLAPGGVLLLHDAFESDPAAPLPEPTFDRAEVLDLVLRGLEERSVRALSVGRLLGEGRPHRTAWFRP